MVSSSNNSVSSLSPNPVYHHLGDHDPDERPPISLSASTVVAGSAAGSASAYSSPASQLSNFQLQQRQWAVVLLSLCTVLLFADQNLMSPNLTAIAEYFGFDDQQRDTLLGGHIALAFFVLGAPASFVIGCWADRYNRSRLFAATVFVGEGACLATYWVRTYPELYVCRALTGISVGGALPLIYSILGDMFAAEERHAVSANVGIGMGFGISFGQGVAGFLGPKFGWRLPFLLISVPALVAAAVFWAIVQDPERGGMEVAVRNQRELVLQQQQQKRRAAVTPEEECIEMPVLDLDAHDQQKQDALSARQPEDYNGEEDDDEEDAIILTSLPSHGFDFKSRWQACRTLLSTPTLVLTVLQGAPGCVPWGIVNTFLNDFLAVDRGMSVERATFVVMIFGAGNFFGLLLGGYGGGWLYRLDCRYPSLLAGCAAILGCLPFWFILNHVEATTSVLLYGPMALLAGLCSGVTGPIVKTTMQNVSLPQTRGTALALFNTFDDFGRGLGPVFVAIMIQKLGGRTPAFSFGVLGWVVCGMLNGSTFFTIRQDEERVQTQIAESLHSSIHRADSISIERGFFPNDVIVEAPMVPMHGLNNTTLSLKSRDPC